MPRHASQVSTDKVYQAIVEYIDKNEFAPSVRDISDAVGLSPSNVLYHLRKLESVGKINRQVFKARTIRLSKPKE